MIEYELRLESKLDRLKDELKELEEYSMNTDEIMILYYEIDVIERELYNLGY